MPISWQPPPKNFTEAVNRCLERLEPGEIDFIRNNRPEAVHNSLGREMRNQWNLWRESALSNDILNKFGLSHADDSSGLILDTVWASIFGYQFDPEAKAAEYREHWESMNQDPKALRPVGAPGRKKKEFYESLKQDDDEEESDEDE